MKKIKELFERHGSLLQFIKFGIVGVSNTAIGYFLNVAVLFILKPYDLSWDFYVANVVSFFLSVLWSFYWNNRYVFKVQEGEKRNAGKALLKTYLSYGFTGIILNNVLSHFWVDVLGISKFVAPLLNLFLSVPINFLMNKLWAFRAQKEDSKSDIDSEQAE